MTSPTISYDKIVFARIIPIDSFSISGSIPNYNNPMVNFIPGITAVQELLRHDSWIVGAHHARGSDTGTDGLFLEHDSEIVVGTSIVFTVADVAEGRVF